MSFKNLVAEKDQLCPAYLSNNLLKFVKLVSLLMLLISVLENIEAVAESVHENPSATTRHHRSQELNISLTSLRRIL